MEPQQPIVYAYVGDRYAATQSGEKKKIWKSQQQIVEKAGAIRACNTTGAQTCSDMVTVGSVRGFVGREMVGERCIKKGGGEQ